jgi:hypothetical protein
MSSNNEGNCFYILHLLRELRLLLGIGIGIAYRHACSAHFSVFEGWEYGWSWRWHGSVNGLKIPIQHTTSPLMRKKDCKLVPL